MKLKTLPLLLVSFSFLMPLSAQSGYFIGDGASGKRILFYSSKMNNPKNDEWVASKIKSDLISDFVNFSKIDVIDSEQKSTILKLQKDSENPVYSDDDPVELGKLIKAKSYITLTTTRSVSGKYSLTAAVYDIETGKTEAAFTSSQYSQSDFITKAHGEAAGSLLPKLGVNLTQAGKRLILYGSFTAEEELTLDESKANLEAIENELTRITKEAASLTASQTLTLSMQSEKSRIETQKTLLETQKKQEQERLLRLEDEAKRKKEEEAKANTRNKELQAQILSISNDIEVKAAKIKQQQASILNPAQRITVIEGEKQILAQTSRQVEQSIQDYNSQIEKEREKALKERKNRVNAKREYNADGTLTSEAQMILNNDLMRINKNYDDQKTANEKAVRSNTYKQIESLKTQINSDMETLSKDTYTADTLLNNGLHIRVDEYDNKEKCWPYTVTFMFAGKTIYTHTDSIGYTSITGKTIPVIPEYSDPEYDQKVKNYYAYLDLVDSYDALFRMSVPFVKATLTYGVESKSYTEPSTYTITVKKITISQLSSGKEVSTTSVLKSFDYKYSPATAADWRIQSKIDSDTKAEQKRLEDEERARVKQLKRDELSRRLLSFNQNQGYGSMTGVRAGIGTGSEDFLFDIDLRYAYTPYIFMVTQVGSIPLQKEADKICSSDHMWEWSIGFGANRRIAEYLPVNLFAYGGIGVSWIDLNCGRIEETSSSSSSSSSSYDDTYVEYSSYFLMRCAFGADIPVTKNFALYIQDAIDLSFELGTTNTLSLGAAYTIPRHSLSSAITGY